MQTAIKYAQQNPQSSYAQELQQRIQSGNYNDVLSQMGIDVSKFGTSTAPTTPASTPASNPVEDFVGDTAKNAENAVNNAGTAIVNDSQTEGAKAAAASNPLDKAAGTEQGIQHVAGDMAGGVEQTIAAPITTGVNDIADAISSSPTVQKIAQALPDFTGKLTALANSHPEIAHNLSDLFNLGSAAVAPEAAEEAAPIIKDAASSASDGIASGVDKAKTAIQSTKDAQAAETAVKTQAATKAAALKDVTPDYESATPTAKGKLISQPTVKGDDGEELPRVQEGGTLKGRTVTPTPLEKEAATELQNVPGYDPKATALQKYQLAKGEIATRGQALSDSLENEKIAVPPKEIVSTVRKAVNEVPKDSLLLQKSDPAIKNYMRVVNNAVSKTDGTLKGVLDLRKSLDNTYQNARGKMAFGSDKLSALDEVHTAARDALTKYLIDHAQNTNVQDSLRSQWNLYRAADELQNKAEHEEGSTVGRLMQKHPITTKVIKAGARTVARGVTFGAADHLIQ
jgi:hypothetical protein